MTIEINKEFTFEAAHKLPNVAKDHKCGRLHGHSYKIKLHLKGEIDVTSGWFIDFSELTKIFKPTLDMLDHRYLNDISGLENPTAEILAMWLWKKIKDDLPHLSAIEIMETCTSGVLYRGV